jgi:hypothetical protein
MKIILDIDDVLADTVAALEKHLGPAVDPTSEWLDDFFPGMDFRRHLNDPDFNRTLPPVPGSIAGVLEIATTEHSFIYLSARIPDLSAPTQEWLNDNGYPSAPLLCVGRQAKQDMLDSLAYNLLIDDQLKYLDIASRRGIRALAYAYPWNASWEGARFDTWDALISSIR